MLSLTMIFHATRGLPVIKTWTSLTRTTCVILTSRSTFSVSNCLQSNIKCSRNINYNGATQEHRELVDMQRNFCGTLLVFKRGIASGSFSKAEVTRDVLLYKNDKGTFFRILGVFAFAQLLFWTYLTHTAYMTMRDTDTYMKVKYGEDGPPEEMKNWRSWAGVRVQLSSGSWRYAITALSIGAGTIIFVGSFLYSRRSIYRIVLRKGGEDVTIQTYGAFGILWRFTTPLRSVSCEHSRQGVRTQLPVKVKGHRLFYILDKDGKFYNARLFDATVGVHRMV